MAPMSPTQTSSQRWSVDRSRVPTRPTRQYGNLATLPRSQGEIRVVLHPLADRIIIENYRYGDRAWIEARRPSTSIMFEGGEIKQLAAAIRAALVWLEPDPADGEVVQTEILNTSHNNN